MYLLSKGAAVKNIADASMELDVQAEVAGKLLKIIYLIISMILLLVMWKILLQVLA